MPAEEGGSCAHQAMNCSRLNERDTTRRPTASTACTWITRLARSTPTRAISTRVISLMDFPFLSFRLMDATQSWCFDTVTGRWEVPSYSIERTRNGGTPLHAAHLER
jgi:hypothetical protein